MSARPPAPAPAGAGPGSPPHTRPFFWLVYAFLALVWTSVMADPDLRRAPVVAGFTALLVLHGALHSRVERLVGRRQAVVYLAGQTALVLALVLLARGLGLSSTLVFPLAGEAFGLFDRAWQRVLVLGALGSVWAAGLLLTRPAADFLQALPMALLSFAVVGVYVVLYTRQAEERGRAEALLAELQAAHRRLADYAARVEELSVAQERQRMARELHDTLAQGLAGLIMQLEAVDDLLGRGQPERAGAVVTRAMARARTTLAEARASIQALRAPLEREDLVAAIGREVDAVRAETGLNCSLTAGPGHLRPDAAAAETLYRAAREGLANAVRHARASQVAVRLWSGEGQVHLEIIDDGVGFDPAAAAGRPGHYGLVGLGERVRLAGGTLAIDSRPGGGARLAVSLPAGPPTGEA